MQLLPVVVGKYISAVPPDTVAFHGFYMEFHSGFMCAIITLIAVSGRVWLWGLTAVPGSTVLRAARYHRTHHLDKDTHVFPVSSPLVLTFIYATLTNISVFPAICLRYQIWNANLTALQTRCAHRYSSHWHSGLVAEFGFRSGSLDVMACAPAVVHCILVRLFRHQI